MTMAFYLVLVALCFIIPLLNLKFHWMTRKDIGLYGAMVFSTLVAGLVVFRVVAVVPDVPKIRYDDGPTRVKVCNGHDAIQLEAIRAKTFPKCELEFYTDEELCECVSVGEQIDDPMGYVEFVLSPIDEDGVTDWTVNREGEWTDENGTILPTGKLLGGCGRASIDERVQAHEIGHICGYHHAIGDPTGKNARLHVMSPSIDSVGSDTRGLDVDHGMLYIPIVVE